MAPAGGPMLRPTRTLSTTGNGRYGSKNRAPAVTSEKNNHNGVGEPNAFCEGTLPGGEIGC